MTSIRTSVHAKDGTFIAWVPATMSPQCQEELNGDGSGQFQIHFDDERLRTYPNLLDGDNVVKMRVTNAPGMVPRGWIIEDAVPTRTDTGGRAARLWTVTGRGMRARPLSGGVVYPEVALTASSADDRAFDFSSKDGPWRVTGDWTAPMGVRWDLETTHRANHPVDWPDTNAYWIWSVDPETGSAGGRNWFRSSFTLASPANVGFFAAGDNVFSLRLNGEEILASDFIDPYGWQKMFRVDRTLAAGTYQVAAWCHNTGPGNPAGFLCDIATLDSDGIPLTVLLRTNTTDWLCHTYAPPEPGFHASQILKVLTLESVARAEMGGVPVTIGYTDTLDTDGNPWTDIQAVTFPVNTDLLTVVQDLTARGMDVEMAHDYTLNAWVRRGSDLSGSLTLRPARDIEQNVPTVRRGNLFNSALVRHGTGWKLVEDATSITAHGRRATGITTGNTDSETQAVQAATRFFEENAAEQTNLPFTISSETRGPKPYRDFGLGDVLSVPGVDGVFIPARCMSIAMAQSQPGVVTYDLNFYPEP